MSKYKTLKETGRVKTKIFFFSYNPRQNIWNKIEKPSKTGQVKKSLISTFACFSTAIAIV